MPTSAQRSRRRNTQPPLDPDFGDEYRLPPPIVSFMLALAEPQPGESVLGIGFDDEILRQARESDSGGSVDTRRVGTPPTELESLRQVYDVVLCAPVFGAASGADGRARSEEFWLEWSVAHLAPEHGRAVVIVPTGLLSNYSQRPLRERLVQHGGMEAIVELPPGWASTTAVQASILLIGATAPPSGVVRMCRVFSAPEGRWVELASALKSYPPVLPEGVAARAYTVRSGDLGPLRLDAQYYDPQFLDIPQLDPSVFTRCRLADLVEIRSGDQFDKDDFETTGVPLVQVSQITENGRLDLKRARYVKASVGLDSRGHGIAGDVLVTVAGTIGKVALVGDKVLQGVAIDTSIRRLRVRKADKRILPAYLALYLRSQRGQLQFERLTSGSVIKVLPTPHLGELMVDVPPLDRQALLVDQYHRMLDAQAAKLLAAYPDERQMKLALEPVPPPTHISISVTPAVPWQTVVKNQLPFPIARAYTAYEIGVQNVSSIRLRQLLDVSEAVVYYVYGVLASDYIRRLNITDVELADRFTRSLGNFSIDRRLEFCTRLLSLAKSDDEIHLFVPALVDAEVGICSDIHNNVRNHVFHVSNPPEEACRRTLDKYHPRLERLLKSLLSLKDVKLALISSLARKGGRFMHTVVSMMGNNPLFPSEILDLDTALDADTQHVILIDRDTNALELQPFYMLYQWQDTGLRPHLCFLKQTRGEPPNQQLRVESTEGVGDVWTDNDGDLGSLVSLLLSKSS